MVAEEVSQQEKENFDANHFLYSTYHLNHKRNVAYEFLRMYYMMEKVSRNKSQFDLEIQNEYRDYYTAFTEKYGFTPTQYSSFLFGELRPYYSDINGLMYTSMWGDVEKNCGETMKKEIVTKVIDVMSQPIEKYNEWAIESEKREWDFSGFMEFPFIKDNEGKYISISDITLRNAFFEKIFWLIRNCYPKEDSRAMAFFWEII